MEALLLLADGRFPGGGYAHSGGVEAAIHDGSIHDRQSLADFVTGRAATSGFVDAWLAASAQIAALVGDSARLEQLDDECEARLPATSLRTASEALGRGLRRAAAASWPAVAGLRARHQPVVLGIVAAAAGLTSLDAARLALHGAVMNPLCAAPKLMALDMAEALAVVAASTELVNELARDANAIAVSGSDGPRRSAPMIDERAQQHANWEVRLFAT